MDDYLRILWIGFGVWYGIGLMDLSLSVGTAVLGDGSMILTSIYPIYILDLTLVACYLAC